MNDNNYRLHTDHFKIILKKLNSLSWPSEEVHDKLFKSYCKVVSTFSIKNRSNSNFFVLKFQKKFNAI